MVNLCTEVWKGGASKHNDAKDDPFATYDRQDGGGGGGSVCASTCLDGERRHVGEVGFQIHGLARQRLPFYTREGSLLLAGHFILILHLG